MAKVVNTDLYKILDFVDEIKSDHIEDGDYNTLNMGILGYIGSLFSHQLQNNIIVASETANEVLINRARLDRSVLTQAIIVNVSDINAIPAKMEILLGIEESSLIANLDNNIFKIDSDIPMLLGDFEYHIDYDIDVTRTISNITNENIYSAKYDMETINELSDISNPYLSSPIIFNIDNLRYVFLRCVIRQVQINKIYNKILTDDSIENKTFDFVFENQLTDFVINVTDNEGVVTTLYPVFEGMPLEDNTKKYCYYSYIDSSTIRVLFIRTSFEPRLNNDITVITKTTMGSAGVFKYSEDVIVPHISDKYSYTGITYILKPITDSEYGIDRKSVADLKRIIPKEMLARKSISTEKDLHNFFNQLEDKKNKMLFLKKVANQLERTYYSYILLKDDNDNIVPSNTLNMEISANQFDSESDSRYVIKPGTCFKYNAVTDSVTKIPTPLNPEEVEQSEFIYANPFVIAVNKYPLSISTYLNLFNRRYLLDFTYINNNSNTQFISTKVTWTRELLNNPNTYVMKIVLNQNINEERNLVVTNPAGDIISSALRVIAVLFNESNEPIRYVDGEILSYDKELFSTTVNIPFTTDDTVLTDSRLKITNMKDIRTVDVSDAYFQSNGCHVDIHILADLDQEYGNNNLSNIIPGLEGYTLCNTYQISGGLDFLVNFTDVIKSKVTVQPDTINKFTINAVPLLKYSYTRDSSSMRYLVDKLLSRKVYIDDAIALTDDAFGIDLKFFNTYGASKVFTIGYAKEPLDRVNLKLRFRAKVRNSSDEAIKSIIIDGVKSYIENITDVNNIHISNIITYMTNTYTDIIYMEFLGINNYDASYQYIDAKKVTGFYVPEFLNINSKSISYNPDIEISFI